MQSESQLIKKIAVHPVIFKIIISATVKKNSLRLNWFY
jgi:hypothetical protein